MTIQQLSDRLLNAVIKSESIEQRRAMWDQVMGEGHYDQFIGDVYDALRVKAA